MYKCFSKFIGIFFQKHKSKGTTQMAADTSSEASKKMQDKFRSSVSYPFIFLILGLGVSSIIIYIVIRSAGI